MKLYRSSLGAWLRTQEEARTYARENGGTFEKIDVPTGQQELADFLTRIEDHHFDQLVEAHYRFQVEREQTTKAAPQVDDIASRAARDISIEEAIGEADYARSIRLAEHVHCRLMEHARATARASA